MALRTSLLTLSAAVAAIALGGCFVSVDSDPVYLATYEPCAFSSECLPADACYEITVDYGTRIVTDGMCTTGCSSDAGCPTGSTGERGACYDIGMGFLCYERCFDDFDCPSLFGCVSTIGGSRGDAICLPQ